MPCSSSYSYSYSYKTNKPTKELLHLHHRLLLLNREEELLLIRRERVDPVACLVRVTIDGFPIQDILLLPTTYS